MIQIEAQGEHLDLYADTRIEFEFISPAFAPEGEGGSFGYPFSLPGTSKNHRLTGFAYHLQKRDVLGISIPARISVFGLPIADGLLKLTYPVSQRSIRAFIVVNTFADLVKDQSLQSVQYAAPQTFSAVGSGPADFMDARVTPGSDDFAFYPSLAHVHQNPYENGFDAWYRDIVPHPYVRHVYRSIMEHNGYTFEDAFFLEDDLKNLTLYHHRHVDLDFAAQEFTVDIKKLVPDTDIAVFIKALDSLFNTRTFVDNRRKNLKLLPLANLLDASHIDWTSRADSNYEVEPFDPEGFTLSFNWSDIDSFHENIYEEGFKRAVSLNSYYFWDNKETASSYEGLADIDGTLPGSGHFKTVWVEDAKVFYYFQDSQWNRLQYQFIDGDGDPFATANPIENGVYFDKDTHQYWIWIKQEYGSETKHWRQFSHPKTEELEIGLGNTPIKANAHSTELFYADHHGLPLPTTKIPVTGSGNDGGNREEMLEDGSIRLLIYRGLDATVYPGLRYPFATPDEFDTRGTLAGTHSLRWNGERGLHEKFWKRWLEFLGASRKVARRLRLTAADLFNLDLTGQVRIENTNFLIGKINVVVTIAGIGPARCELYTVGSGTAASVATTSGNFPAGGIGTMSVGTSNQVG